RLGMRRIVLSEEDIERVEQLAAFAAIRPHVQDALAALPAVQADALLLRIGEGLPYREVARRLGCSEGAARVRVSRGLQALGDRLPDQWEGTP
ncbi:MAG: sigma-70 region 4 domain-containing protein, partial [Actinomycetota bacterium]